MTDQKENNSSEWHPDKLADEASLRERDEFHREIHRGDETEGEADERDVAGSADSKDTPQGREETKNDKEGVANVNG